MRLTLRAWHSPTLMTWGSIGARVLTLVLVLPMVLAHFSADQVALWYLFSTIIGLQVLMDIGFTPTTTRVVSFALGGASVDELKDMRAPKRERTALPVNDETIGSVVGTLRPVFMKLAAAAFVLMAIGGTVAVLRPIAASSDPAGAWTGWAVIVFTSCLTLWSGTYSSYLQGVGEVALLRRWEMLTALCAIFTSFVVLLAGGGLLALILANQFWAVVAVLRNRQLCMYVRDGAYRRLARRPSDVRVMAAVWPSAWRSGLGMLMSNGVVQATGVFYAQVAEPKLVAAYLLALRLITVLSQFSQAPFYSKIPALARLRASGDVPGQVSLARRGMVLAYWTYVAGFAAIGFLAQPLLALIGSEVHFVPPGVWALMGLAIFVERYGAMHIQLYSTTNHIIWHVANGVTGTIVVVLVALLHRPLGVAAFPTAILVGYLAFYAWYAAMHSYTSLGLSFWRFEAKVAIPAGLAAVVASGTMLVSR